MVDDVNGDACFNLIKQISPDVVVFEGSRIIKSPIFDLPNIGMLNVHSAILPYLRGCSCLEWSILNNYPVGVTCHFIIAKVDAGPIVKRVQLHYDKNDTYYDIRAKIIYLTAFAMGKAVKEVIKKGDIGINIEEKGLWYSPIKDKEKLLNVCTIISEHKYIPKIINDNLPLIEADVNLKTGKVSRIK
jgi:methionyl-tRNA formyltransferase